eukprot:TRINITY_DN31704_c0_g1_i1.p3 TRINITY_DN31704_c0_g1~~TRINITY_DN31704_c0_g1_i1.p3  ORF type:complete len:122 (+),score=33.72 TRINITY_DN31704_c0_g1_i1:243-608(+)
MDKSLNSDDIFCNSEALLESESESTNSDEEDFHAENLEDAEIRELGEKDMVNKEVEVEKVSDQSLVPTILLKIEPKSPKGNLRTNKGNNRLYFQRVKSVKRGAMFVAHGVVRRGFEILNTI